MLAAHADIHTRVEPGGLVVISNVAPVSTAAVTTPAPARAQPAVAPRAGLQQASFPRVTPDQQRSRDADRRAILQEELAAEQTALARAQGEQLRRHQANVAALQRELQSVR
jgi:hypothetical protein